VTRYAKLEAKNADLQAQLSAVGGDAGDLQLEIEALRRELADTIEAAQVAQNEHEVALLEANEAHQELDKKMRGLRDTLMHRFSDAQAKVRTSLCLCVWGWQCRC